MISSFSRGSLVLSGKRQLVKPLKVCLLAYAIAPLPVSAFSKDETPYIKCACLYALLPDRVNILAWAQCQQQLPIPEAIGASGVASAAAAGASRGCPSSLDTLGNLTSWQIAQ